MKIELFTLCDGAFNYNGKLTIVGTVDGIKVPSLPGLADFSVAMKLLVLPGEEGQKLISLHLYDSTETELPANVSMNFSVASQTTESHLSVALSMHGIPFKEEGMHKIVVKHQDEMLGEFYFYVKSK